MALLTDRQKGYFQSRPDPGIDTGHAVKIVARKSAAGGDIVDLRVQLYRSNGTTLVKEWLLTNLGSAWTEHLLTLTEAEAATIPAADYANRLVYAWQREGDATAVTADNRSAQVSYVRLVVPDTQTTELRPDSIPASANLGTPDFNVLREDPDSPVTTWLTATTATADTSVRIGFDNPTTALTGAQTFKAFVRKTAGTPNPTLSAELWQTGGTAPLKTLTVTGALIDSTTGKLATISGFNAGDVASGNDVQLRLIGTAGQSAGGAVSQNLVPSSISGTNITGVVGNITDDPAAPDTLYVSPTDDSINYSFIVAFGAPSGPLTGTQTLRVFVRKTPGINNGSFSVDIDYGGGTFTAGVIPSTVMSSATGTMYSFNFDAASVVNRNALRIQFNGVSGTGKTADRANAELGAARILAGVEGTPTNTNTVEYGAVEWVAQHQMPSSTNVIANAGVTLTPSIDAGATRTAPGVTANAGVTLLPTIDATATRTPPAFTANAGVTLAPTVSAGATKTVPGFTANAGVTLIPTVDATATEAPPQFAANAGVALAPTVSAGATYTAPGAGANASVTLQPSIDGSASTTVPTFTANAGVTLVPTVGAGATRTVPAFNANAETSLQPTVNAGVAVAAPSFTANTGVTLAPGVDATATRTAAGFNANAEVTLTPNVDAGATKTIPSFTANAGVTLAPSVNAGSTVAPPAFTANAGVTLAPSVNAGGAVMAPGAGANANVTLQPSVNATASTTIPSFTANAGVTLALSVNSTATETPPQFVANTNVTLPFSVDSTTGTTAPSAGAHTNVTLTPSVNATASKTVPSFTANTQVGLSLSVSGTGSAAISAYVASTNVALQPNVNATASKTIPVFTANANLTLGLSIGAVTDSEPYKSNANASVTLGLSVDSTSSTTIRPITAQASIYLSLSVDARVLSPFDPASTINLTLSKRHLSGILPDRQFMKTLPKRFLDGHLPDKREGGTSVSPDLTYHKTAWETVNIGIDWQGWLKGDPIVTSTVTTVSPSPALTVTPLPATSQATHKTYLRVAGGEVGKKYAIKQRLETEGGQRLEASIFIVVDAA